VTTRTSDERTSLPPWLEQAWLTRYLDRQLSADESAWFEAYALDAPHLLTAIEDDTRLRDAVAGSAPGWPIEQPAASAMPGFAPPEYVKAAGRAQQATRWLALAATLVLGLGVSWFGRDYVFPGSIAPEIVANPTRILYDTMRGESASSTIEPGDSASPYILLQVAVPDHATDIHLIVDEAQSPALTAAHDGLVTALISRNSIARARKSLIKYRVDGVEQQQPVDLSRNGAADPKTQ